MQHPSPEPHRSDSRLLRTPVTLTLVVDNHVDRRGLLAEHGLCWHVRWGSDSLLFDTGQGLALEHNAAQLGLELNAVQAVVLSHGHYDHTGGLLHVLSRSSSAQVFAHPAAFDAKYSRRSLDQFVPVGIPVSSERLGLVRERLAQTTTVTEVRPGLWCTGSILRCTGAGGIERRFFLDSEGRSPDSLVDDQALFFDTEEGLVVILGCAHAGVPCTLRYIQALRPGRPIAAVLGGMHMSRAPAPHRQSVVRALLDFRVQQVAPAHCSGPEFVAELRAAYLEQCHLVAVADAWSFESFGKQP